jgi:hypothetical protein
VGTTSPARTLSITNPNTSVLTVTSISVTAPFGLAANSCGSSISAGGTCQVSLTFNPTTDTNAIGTNETGKVTIVDNGKTASQTVALSGTAYGTPTSTGPVVSFVSPTSRAVILEPAIANESWLSLVDSAVR